MRAAFVGLFLALISSLGAEPKFVAPDESYPLLRRDLLPLDVDGIQELASQLAVLGDGPMPNDPLQLRERVKILTLSQRLSPSEPRARAALKALSLSVSRIAPSSESLETAREACFSSAKWLIELPAESEGNHLGNLLLDVLAQISPANPLTQRRDADGEASRWRGVIANPSEFTGSPAPREDEPEMTTDPEIPEVSDQPLSFQITELITGVPMLCKGPNLDAPAEPLLVKTSLILTEGDENHRGLDFHPNAEGEIGGLDQALVRFFENNKQALPKNYRFNIDTDGRQYSNANEENIGAPIAMMLDSALSGRPLRRNTYFFARLSDDGTLERPAKAWEILLKLIETKVPRGTRLIVGPGLEEELTALLVLQKADFFVNFEVIEAPTFEIARTLFYDDGSPENNLATAIAGYDEVRTKAFVANSLATFLSLNAVEERLVKARDASPLHLSARMLAAQSVRRPAYFSRYMVAQELDRRLEPLARFDISPEVATDRKIRDIYRETRESIQPLERLVELQEEVILKEALDFIQQLNSIARIDDQSFQTTPALIKFKEDLKELRAKLRLLYESNHKK